MGYDRSPKSTSKVLYSDDANAIWTPNLALLEPSRSAPTGPQNTNNQAINALILLFQLCLPHRLGPTYGTGTGEYSVGIKECA